MIGRMIVTISLVALFLGIAIPQTAVAKKYSIHTEPVPQGRIFVNGEFVGVAPVTIKLKPK